MSDAFTRERAYQERLQRAYDERRNVQLRLTPKQALALVTHYERLRETDPLPTVLHAAFQEVARALDESPSEAE
jgi:hypothetical protein